ncbi:MAG TPA: M36 family metallopeptidase [Pyrinomonadaceae bacterium]|nr:M36 family metallopeptidase [Pyrinomonadaceae bacterium]
MKPRRLITFRMSLTCAFVAVLLASTLFVSSAEQPKQIEVVPQELDVRVAGGVLKGGQLTAPDQSENAGQQSGAQSLVRTRNAEASQVKALQSLERLAGSKLSIEYNRLTGTPRHMFARSGYLSPQRTDVPEKIARDFISHWQGVFRFTEHDVTSLKLRSRATLPDLGTTVLLFEQRVDGVPVYKGEVMVNVNRAGQVINVGGDSYPQLKVANSVSLTPAQAIVAATKSLGFEGFVPQQQGTKKVARTFGDLPAELIDAPRFSGGDVSSDDIVVTHVIFPMGDHGRHAYNFVLTTPRFRGIMWNNIVDAQTGEVLRRTSLTAFQAGGGPVTSRRATFRPDVQNFVEDQTASTASGKVFDGMPTALSGRRTCSGNLPGRPCNGAAGTGGTLGPGYGRSTAPGDRPDYQANENELDRNNGRGFKESLVKARVESPYSDVGGPLISQIFNTPYGQVLRGFPDATNPTSQRYGSRFGWFYLPTGTGGTEIAEADNNRASTRAYKYEMPPEAVTRNLAANSPVADKSQPFSADLTPLSSSVTLRDGRVLSSVFQSRYTEGNNVLVADDRFNDDETTTGVRGYSANRQFTAGYFDFLNGYEYGGADAKSAIPGTMGLVACTVINLCEVYVYPPPTEQDVYPGAMTLFYYNNILHDYLYSVGFTETTWNFQQDNFGLGGAGQDALSGQVQDGSGTDNANMSTPNDGSPPRMQMFLFTESGFRRADGDFDFDVVAHEFYHGVSNRSAGKGTADCLGTPLVGESGGQGEGWSDYIACSMTDDDATGEFVTGEFDIGIRRLPNTNYRWSYGSLNGNGLNRRDQGLPDPDPGAIPFEVHDVGEVFTAMLWDMRELMIMKDPNGVFFDGTRRLATVALPTNAEFYIGPRRVRSRDLKHPIDYRPEFNTTVLGATISGGPTPPGGITPPEATQTQVPSIKADEHIIRPGLLAAEIQSNGNRNGGLATAVANGARLADTLVLRGLQLSPCNPSIVATRDSILLADEELTGGENRAIIWRAFASHGVGTNATSSDAQGSANVVVEDFTVPAAVTACEQLGPLAAPGFALANTAANRITVTINGGVPVVGAAQYTITRSFKAEGPFTKIAEIPASQTTYQDENLSGGQTYFYQVRASRDTDTICVSTANTLSIAVTNGITITPPPTFFGADAVADPQTGTTLVVKWNPAITPNPAGDAFTICADCVYDVYRVEQVEPGDGTQEPTFTPSDANRIAQGITGNEYTDSVRQLGQIYYYIVQARNTAGKKDTNDAGNRQVRYNIPTITSFKSLAPFPLETYESASADGRFQPPLQEAGNDPKEDQPVWQRVTNVPLPANATSATMYAPDFDPGSDGASSDISTVIGPLALTATSIMDFDHFFSAEARFDGGVLEIAKGGPNFNSTPYPDNVTTFDLGNYIVEGLYNSKLDGDLLGAPGTALLGRRAYSGIKGLHHVRVALGEFASGGDNNQEGLSIYIRFRMSSDVGTTNGAEAGWYVDNVVVHDLGTDTTPTPTPTPTPTVSPTPTPTPTVTPTPTPTPTPNPSPTPLPTSIVQFSSTLYATTEACSHVNVQVIRSGTTAGRVTVDLISVDGTAKQKGDYTNAVSRLTFEPGVTQKVVPVLTCEDSYSEGPESFTLTLSNPTGGSTLGGASTTTVQIADDASETAANPIDDPRIFACQHYHDFLARPSDPSGEDFWTNETASCGTNASCIDGKRVHVSAAFFFSIEFQQTGYFVIRAQKAAFGSDKSNPRYAVFLRDQRQIGEGVVFGQPGADQLLEQNKQKYLDEFVSGTDFVTQFPQGSTAAFYVDKLFTNAGATPTTAERNAAITAYGSGDQAGRIAAFRNVVDSDAVFLKLYNPAFVLAQYYGYLRRNPDDAPDNNFSGYDFWLNKLEQFTLPDEDVRDEVVAFRRVARAEMVRSFLVSVEYRQRFGGSPSGNQQGTQQSPIIAERGRQEFGSALRHVVLQFVRLATSPG